MTKRVVLLIEDSPDLQQYLPPLLEQDLLFQVATVSSLTEGKEYLAGHTVDVVLLDLLLPDSPLSGDSLETMRLLQSFCPNVPVVVMTGDATVGVEDVLSAGAQEFLAKPVVNREQLQAALLRAIVRHRVRPAYLPLKSALDTMGDAVQQLAEIHSEKLAESKAAGNGNR